MQTKKAQIMGLPFQLIFSIILIAVFLYVAVIAIKSILQTGESLKVANFVSDFRSDLEEAMGTTESIVPQKYALPTSITQLCFSPRVATLNVSRYPYLTTYQQTASQIATSFKGNYVFFYPPANAEKILGSKGVYAKVDCETGCLNLTSTGKNPYCINNTNGIVKIIISKEIGKPYITIK